MCGLKTKTIFRESFSLRDLLDQQLYKECLSWWLVDTAWRDFYKKHPEFLESLALKDNLEDNTETDISVVLNQGLSIDFSEPLAPDQFSLQVEIYEVREESEAFMFQGLEEEDE